MTLATDKCRVSTYIKEDLKAKLEKLAEVRSRSVSNLIEITLKKEVEKAEKEGEI